MSVMKHKEKERKEINIRGKNNGKESKESWVINGHTGGEGAWKPTKTS